MTQFLLVQTANLTDTMLYKSTSGSLAEVPIKVYNGVPFYLLEVPEENLNRPEFDGYRRYTRASISNAVPEIRFPLKTKGILTGSVSTGATKSFDYTLTEGRRLFGAVLCISGSSFGDNFDLDAYSGQTLISKYIENFYVMDGMHSIDLPSVVGIPAGITLRFTYRNTGLLTANFAITIRALATLV